MAGTLRHIVDKFYDAYNSGEFEPGLDLLDLNVETIVPGAPRLPGRESFRTFLQTFKNAAPDSRLHILSYLESGNRVVVEGTFTGTHTGPLVSPQGEIPASGKAFEVRYADLFDVKDGKVTSHRVYYDQVELMTQLGLMPQPGQPRA